MASAYRSITQSSLTSRILCFTTSSISPNPRLSTSRLGLHLSSSQSFTRHVLTRPTCRFQTTFAPPPPQQSQPTSKPKRTIFRILGRTLWFSSISITFFILGTVVGLYTSPMFSQAIALAKYNAISDSETNSLYNPPDEHAARINKAVTQHPLAIELRSDSKFTEARPHLKIPEDIRPTNLTGGTLAGRGKIEVPPVIFSEEGGKSMVSIFHLGEQLCGHPGLIHGGLLATLLDEGLARCCFPALPNKLGVTANLKIDYRKPARADGLFVLKARTVKVEGRKAWVEGWIESLDREELKGVKLVEATALFIEPKNAGMMRRLYAD